MTRMRSGSGFIAALDQSGGSTPKALLLYGVDESKYQTEKQMFDLVHKMRTRIITNPTFNSDAILGTILFEHTMDRDIEDQRTSKYLWLKKQIVPFLKIDVGLAEETDGVQIMKPNPNLNELLQRAKSLAIFGTKMRSVIKAASPSGVNAIVAQQFDFARQIHRKGLVPIIEPEVDISISDKSECEELLRQSIFEHLDTLDGDLPIILKLTLPNRTNFYNQLCKHPRVLRVVALSGGYTRNVANQKLTGNKGVIASFSRALTEGLIIDLSEEEFTKTLGKSIAEISTASGT